MKRQLAGVLREICKRVEYLLEHPVSACDGVRYWNALTASHDCLLDTLQTLNRIYTQEVLLPAARQPTVYPEATAAVTLWVLMRANA